MFDRVRNVNLIQLLISRERVNQIKSSSDTITLNKSFQSIPIMIKSIRLPNIDRLGLMYPSLPDQAIRDYNMELNEKGTLIAVQYYYWQQGRKLAKMKPNL